MQVRSLGFRTDLLFARFDGQVDDRGDHVVVTTPTNPGYWWGNFLLFERPPREGDLIRWKALFAAQVGDPRALGHVAFGIDGTDGDAGVIDPFLEDGFELDRGVVMTARQVVRPPRPNGEVEVRPLRDDREWRDATANQVLYLPESMRSEGFSDFKKRQMDRYRAMCEAGAGDWFGAFRGDALVADLGLFHDGPYGRFQSVGTHPDHRRRGICATLVHEAARFAFRNYGIRTLVMVADEGSAASRIYGSVGFEAVETTLGMARRYREHADDDGATGPSATPERTGVAASRAEPSG